MSLSQIVAADQALWQKVSQETRGMILTSGDPKPVDKAVMEFMDCAEVTYHLLPTKDGHNPDKPPKPPKNPKNPKTPQSRMKMLIVLLRRQRLIFHQIVRLRMIQIRTCALDTTESLVRLGGRRVVVACTYVGGRAAARSRHTRIAPRVSHPSDKRRTSWMEALEVIQLMIKKTPTTVSHLSIVFLRFSISQMFQH